MAKLHQPGDIVKQSLRGHRSQPGSQDLVSIGTWIFLGHPMRISYGFIGLIAVFPVGAWFNHNIAPWHTDSLPCPLPMSMTSTRFLPTKRSQNTTAKSASLPVSTWLAGNKPQIPGNKPQMVWMNMPAVSATFPIEQQQEFQTISVQSVPKSSVHTCRLVLWKPVDLPKNMMGSRIGSGNFKPSHCLEWS